MTPDVASTHVLERDQGFDVGLLGRLDPGVDLAASGVCRSTAS